MPDFETAQLRILLEHAPVALAMFDRRMRYLHASRRWRMDFGLGDGELRGHAHDELFPDLHAPWQEAHERGLAGEVVRVEEDRFVRADGLERWVRWEVRPWHDDTGAIGGIMVVAEDITGRRRAAEGLNDREERLRAILSTVVDAIITIDRRGTIVGVNQATEKMFGYTEAEMLGQNVSMLMPSPDREQHDGYLEKYHRTGQAKIIGIGRETQARRKDGSIFPIELAVSEVGHLNVFTGVVRDVTQRKQLEAEILRISEDERQRVAADLHDGICQELTGISFVASALERDLAEIDPDLATRARRVQHAISDAATHTKAVARGMNPVVADGAALMHTLLDLTTRTSQRRGVRCDFECRADVVIDDTVAANQLYRIAQEAIHNAIRHGHAQRITVNLSKSVSEICLTVRDNGTGIRPEQPPSSGMGLRTMKYRASLIGGQLSIQPRKGGGTEVACRVPILPSRP